jgi:hypothetical protein
MVLVSRHSVLAEASGVRFSRWVIFRLSSALIIHFSHGCFSLRQNQMKFFIGDPGCLPGSLAQKHLTHFSYIRIADDLLHVFIPITWRWLDLLHDIDPHPTGVE